ncbi:hypothetical protein O7635_23755 [Asanoa sp. WMMD1127]|uniref:hypothetical protein n=1 Tax=Asanoa sp. WMMD1127 TaxID=3016107 RepID=UPI0024173D96|nr:hypothetical protein [Asanoa sp. WMMD1127]MDG4824876.1 hypothetical protein [Asanoa sp. WMMD1127]
MVVLLTRVGFPGELGGRWRHGFVTISPHHLHWRPRRPRPGPPLSLRGVTTHGRPRSQEWHEHWWLAPGVRIYRLTATNTGHAEWELAVVAESVRLFDDLVVRERPNW